MDSGDLILQGLRAPRRFLLPRPVWEASAALAGLRVAANDLIRAADRDRGPDKNWLADIWGVIGELVALRRLNELTDAVVRHHPIDFERSVDDVDLRVETPDGPLLLEAKAHLIQPGKSYFMVNARAHQRSLRRGAVGYIPVLTALGARRALVGPLLTVGELDAWRSPAPTLRDPAIGVPVSELCRRHFGCDLRDVEQLVEPEAVIQETELRDAAAQAGQHVARWKRDCPPLGQLRARELVATVLQLKQRVCEPAARRI
jgi:hypothetical protein